MAQYDLGTKTLSKLFPVEYPGYVCVMMSIIIAQFQEIAQGLF